MTIDLSREMDLASDLATPKRIADAGLCWEAVMEAGGIGLLRAETFRDGLYRPADDDEGGRWCWVLPCYYGPPSPANLADIVAWEPSAPARWWRRTGCAAVLGFAAVQKARAVVWDFGRLDGEPAPVPTLTLHATPRDYAASAFTGACVLDWRFGLDELDGIERIACADIAFAERVERELARNRPPLPTVLVQDQRREAA